MSKDDHDDGSDVPVWPLRSDEAKEAIQIVIDVVFDPVLRKTLEEWGQLRQRGRLKAMKKQSLSRIAGKLDSIQTTDQLTERVANAEPDEAYALLSALLWLSSTDAPNQVLMAPYRDEQDHRERWIAVVTKKTLEWAEDEQQLFEHDEYMSYRD